MYIFKNADFSATGSPMVCVGLVVVAGQERMDRDPATFPG